MIRDGHILRCLADGLIAQAERRPPRSHSAHLLRDAAASILDAEAAMETEERTGRNTMERA